MALFRRITFRGSGGINQGLGMNRFTLLYIKYVETSPVVQWLRLCASNAQYVVQGIQIPHVAPCGQKIKIHKQIKKIYGIAQRTIFSILFLNVYLFVHLWLCWVCINTVATLQLQGTSFSLWCLLLLRSAGWRAYGLQQLCPVVSSCSSRALEHDSVVVTCAQLLPGMWASPDQGSSPCVLHRQADCLPLSHQESRTFQYLVMGYNERHLEETRQIAVLMSIICVSMYLYLFHSAVFLKLTPHCKSAYFTSKKYEL